MVTVKRSSSSNGIRKIALKGGKVSYEARINASGQVVSKTFKSKKEAVEWRTKALSQIHTGTKVPTARQSKATVADAIDAYTEHRKTLRNISSNHLTDFAKVKLDMGGNTIKQLTTPLIEAWLSFLKNEPKGYYKDGRPMAPYAEASVRRFFYALKSSVEWYAGQHTSVAVPASVFKLSKSSQLKSWAGHRERRLRHGEEERLYAGGLKRKDCYTRDDWQVMIGFALETAMREQELYFAGFDDVDPEGHLLRIYANNEKTKIGRYIPLSDTAKNIIKLQKVSAPNGEKRIFHQFPSPNAIGTAFTALCARVKIVDLHFHDLRHEAISRMCIKHEMTISQIMKMTGHRSMATFMGYMQLFEEHERKDLLKAQAAATVESTAEGTSLDPAEEDFCE